MADPPKQAPKFLPKEPSKHAPKRVGAIGVGKTENGGSTRLGELCVMCLLCTSDQVHRFQSSFLAGGLDNPIRATPQTAGIAEASTSQGPDESAGRGRGRSGQKVSKRAWCLMASILHKF